MRQLIHRRTAARQSIGTTIARVPNEEIPPSFFHFPGDDVVVASRNILPLLPGFRCPLLLVGQMRGRERVSGDSEPEAARTIGGGSGWLPVS